MWWVGAMPQEAIDLIKAWGFRLVNMSGLVWNKLTVNDLPAFGMGFYTRAGSETVALAVKGKFKPNKRNVRAVFTSEQQIQFHAKLLSHSEKPKEVKDFLIDLVGDVPRLEMFAREETKGWSVFGNEVENSIEIGYKEN
jgi:N6-adenosine-specific RNA methylase IME4